jgi:putative two-component system response regulator
MPERTRAPRILVADDDATSRDLLENLLTAEGYDVIVARGGEEVLSLVAESPPECLVCDVVLPGMDGYEVCRRLKDNDATRLIPVVVITGLSDMQHKLDALEAGADDFLAKPINQLEVAARVRNLVRMRRMTHELESAQNVVFALATAIEQKDNYTEGHGERVAIYAKSLAEHVNLSATEIHAVHVGGVLHDVGKIGCPDAILNKPGPLTPDEFEIIKRHPMHGWEICRHLKSLEPCSLGCIRNHHERLDGSGYPDGLSGDDVPQTVRIMSIADVFDALATARAYKPAFPTATCFKILTEEAERGWWDKELVAAFVDMMHKKGLDSPEERAKLEPIFALPPPPRT